MKFLTYLFSCCFVLSLSAQNVEIRGRATKAYSGKIVQVLVAQDYITNLKHVETSDTIKKDGYFELSFHTEYTQPITIKIDNVVAQMYVQPDFVYGITVPDIDSTMNVNHDVELPINIGIMVGDSTELNNLVFDFQDLYNRYFIASDGRYLSRAAMFKRCDSLYLTANRKYASIKNPFFSSYVKYSVASVNASLSRGEKFLMEQYIKDHPVQHKHSAYMQFFNDYFKGYLTRLASQRPGETMYRIINTNGDYQGLLDFVKIDKEISSDTLRELIILKELWAYNFSSDFDSEAIKTILEQFQRSTKIKEHKLIVGNMLSYINKLRIGSVAPGFSAYSRDNKLMNFSSLKKRWVYLNFFSTANVESMKELPKIAALKKKFGDKIVFVSICLDDSLSDYLNFLKANPKYDWPIWYNYHKQIKVSAKEAYAVTGTEAYFLIDNTGNLIASPALSPSKGIEYKLNVIFKIRKKDTKTGLR